MYTIQITVKTVVQPVERLITKR